MTNDNPIRFAASTDIDDLDRLLYQVHKVHSDKRSDLFVPGEKKYTDDELQEILKDPTYKVFVYELEGKVCGYAFCIIKETKSHSLCPIKTLYIDDLCVDETIRGRHIGTSLYEAVLSYAKENGFYNVTLNVWACNEKALEFYKRIGLSVQKIGMEKIL